MDIIINRHSPVRRGYIINGFIDDRYRVLSEIEGGMGRVYIAEDIATDQIVAVKTINEEHLWQETKRNILRERTSHRSRVIEQFLAEVETWIQLERHQNVVQAKSTLILENIPFVIVEYVEGGSLQAYIQRKKLHIRSAFHIAIQFCTGADYAYRKLGLIHLDIKPGNLLLTRNLSLKITDFGFSRKFQGWGPEGGTPAYMSPEQCMRGGNLTILSDIYSFGVVMYEIFTGKHPFRDSRQNFWKAHAEEIPIDPKIISPQLPSGISEIIMRCLEKNPLHRYPNYEELAENLKMVYKNFFHEEYIQPSLYYTRDSSYSQADLFNSGDALSKIGKYSEALKYYDMLLSKNPESARFWQRKADTLMKLSRFADAELYFNKSLEIEPSLMEAIRGKIECLTVMNREKEALKICSSALLMNPNDKTLLIMKRNLMNRDLEIRTKILLKPYGTIESADEQNIQSNVFKDNKIAFEKSISEITLDKDSTIRK